MHLAFDGRYIQDRFPGIGRYAYHLLLELARRAEGPISLLAQPGARDSRHGLEGLDGAVARLALGAPPLSLAEQLRGPGLIARTGADLYHSPHFVFPYLSRLPAVVTLFDLIPLHHPRELPGASRLAYRMHLAASLRRARWVITASEATSRRLAPLRRDRLSVVPLGVSHRFHPGAGPPPAGLEPGYVLYVGTNKPHKNVPALVEAHRRSGVAAPLVLAGHRDRRYPWPQGAEGRVIVLGEVPEAQLPGLYAAAAGCATLSLDEGFGLPVLEAMACGRPVLVSDRGALPEVVGSAGLVVDPQDPEACAAGLRELIDRPRPDPQALERAARFTWERCAQLTVEAYRRTLAA